MESLKYSRWCSQIIEKMLIFLIIFTPLAFGTVQPWSIAVMQTAAFFVFASWLCKVWIEDEIKIKKEPFLYLLGGLVAYILLQVLPLPFALLSRLAPATAGLYERFSLPGITAWKTVSIHAGATQEELYKLLALSAVFIVIIHHYREREQIAGLVRAVVFMGICLVVFAVVQMMTWNGRIFWFYPVRENLHPIGPYINRNHFAGYLEMAIPLGLGLLLDQASRVDTAHGMPLRNRIALLLSNRRLPWILFFSFAVIAMAGGLFLSLSRGGDNCIRCIADSFHRTREGQDSHQGTDRRDRPGSDRGLSSCCSRQLDTDREPL